MKVSKNGMLVSMDINYNKKIIKQFLIKNKIKIDNFDEILNKITFQKALAKKYLYAKIDNTNPYSIIYSESIDEKDLWKWLNHEIIHIISNNQKTVNDINIGGVIILDKKENKWIGQNLNEAITEYINLKIIGIDNKYADYYDSYLEKLQFIINIIGIDDIYKAYFTNNLEIIIKRLMEKTGKNREEVYKYIYAMDELKEKKFNFNNFFVNN